MRYFVITLETLHCMHTFECWADNANQAADYALQEYQTAIIHSVQEYATV